MPTSVSLVEKASSRVQNVGRKLNRFYSSSAIEEDLKIVLAFRLDHLFFVICAPFNQNQWIFPKSCKVHGMISPLLDFESGNLRIDVRLIWAIFRFALRQFIPYRSWWQNHSARDLRVSSKWFLRESV
jgi:hypothetical protein